MHGFLGYKDYGMFPHLAATLAAEGYITHRFNLSHNGMDNRVGFYDPSLFQRPDLFKADTWNRQRHDINAVADAPTVTAADVSGTEDTAVTLDIGANIGLYTLSLLLRVPGARALSFEPLTRLRMRLEHNLALNGLADRAVVRAEAVGPTGALTLYESGNAGRSSLIPFDGARPGDTVTVRPLAELVETAGAAPPAALKIDVEGFEAAALMPYFDAVPATAWPKAVVIETLHRADWEEDCLQELFQRGYESAGMTDENALLVRPR